jgi:hypothetical protein
MEEVVLDGAFSLDDDECLSNGTTVAVGWVAFAFLDALLPMVVLQHNVTK